MATIAAAAAGIGVGLAGAAQRDKAASRAAQAQIDAANLATLVARELHEHWKAFYRTCDINTIREVCGTPPYAPRYNTVQSRVQAAAIREFQRAKLMIDNCNTHFCVSTLNLNCNFLSGIEAQAFADSTNFGFRREEGVKEQLDQIRLENIRSFLALGKNLLKSSADAARIAAQLGDALKGWQGNRVQGWLQFAGFLGSREGKTFKDDIEKGVRTLIGKEPETPKRDNATRADQSVGFAGYAPSALGAGEQPPEPRMPSGAGEYGQDAPAIPLAQQSAVNPEE